MTINPQDPALQSQLRQLVRKIPAVHTAFLGGSLVEGYGNEGSDLDLIVLTERRVGDHEVPPSVGQVVSFEDKQVLVSQIGSIRLDIELRESRQIENVSTELIDATKRNSFYFSRVLKLDALELVNDLRIGLPIVSVEEHRTLVGNFAWGALKQWLVGRFEYDAHGHLDDASAAVEAEDAGLALLTSRSTLAAAADAYLASRGATNPKSKWRLRKFESLGLSEIGEDYLRHEIDSSFKKEDILRQAARRIIFSQDLLLDARDDSSAPALPLKTV